MMEIQHPTHCPEWRIVQNPSEEDPFASMCYSASLLEHNSVVDITPLLAYGNVHVENDEHYKKNYVSPPNNRVAK